MTACLLGALNIVLTRILSIEIGAIRFGFGFLPILICAVLYGPLISGFTYTISDLIGLIISGRGAPNIGLTVSCFITGVIFGLVLKGKKKNWARISIAHILNTVITGVFINTFFLAYMQGTPFFQHMITRLPTQFLNLVVRIPLTYLIYANVIEQIAKMDVTIELK